MKRRKHHKNREKKEQEPITMKDKIRQMLKKFLEIAILLMFITAVMTQVSFARKDRVAESAVDIARGVTSLPREIAETANESNIINGVVVGTAKGIWGTVENIGKGVFKLFTFQEGH